MIHHRLIVAVSLEDHKLILECFHPSAKLSTPSLSCDYLGTPGLSNETESNGDLYKGVEKTRRLGKLVGLYSYFRPHAPEQDRPWPRAHPAGDIPGYSNGKTTAPGTSQDSGPDSEAKVEAPSHIISLESYEPFSQLCTIVNLVKAGPKRGLYRSCVTIDEGVIRIWRNWLASNAISAQLQSDEGLISRDALSPTSPEPAQERSEQILWLGSKKSVGVRVCIIERQDLSAPILVRSDEDAYISYTLEYKGMISHTFSLPHFSIPAPFKLTTIHRAFD
jgi:hypothetical protein